MISGQIRILLLLAFLFTTALVVVVQYNSNKNIEKLVAGNENLLGEFETKRNFQSLQVALHGIDNSIRRSIISADSAVVAKENYRKAKAQMRQSVRKLGTMQMQESVKRHLQHLDSLAELKIGFSDSVFSILALEGGGAAERQISTGRGLNLNQQITDVTKSLDATRQDYLTEIIKQTDANSLRAKRLGFIMAGLAATIVLFTFLYIINHIRQQQMLIVRLNESEKQVRQAAQVKEHFIANMSHEIRTPMNAILGFTGLLRKQPLGNMAKQYVGYIQSSGETLLGIINDVLDLSKIEAGMMRIEKAPFSLRGLLQSVETMFLPKAEEKKLELFHRVEDTIPDLLNGDSVRLTQILVNLVSNAIKFTAQGYVRINVSQVSLENDAVVIRLTVADSGIGIAKDKLEHVFQRFTQAEENITRRFGGTGLGLSIVQQLVTLQNGTISVTSEPGSGSFFTVEMPFDIVNDEGEGHTPVAAPANNLQLEKLKVLVVEDNIMNQQLMRHLLDGRNIRYDIANNGKEALAILRNETYDLILMDVQMPVMDGYTAARLIRDELKLTTPIIAMTAHAFAGEREKCISFGMNDYLAKPIKEEILFALIGSFANLKENFTAKVSEPAQSKSSFTVINLAYLQELSGGNVDFEQEIMKQFVEQIPAEILCLQLAYSNSDWTLLKSTAHNLKTTVSFLGLHQKLDNHLSVLEKRNEVTIEEVQLSHHLQAVLHICNSALSEAKTHLSQVNNN
jgi:signal transduction histidine kinase/DNA-binding response OmpR family regulator